MKVKYGSEELEEDIKENLEVTAESGFSVRIYEDCMGDLVVTAEEGLVVSPNHWNEITLRRK